MIVTHNNGAGRTLMIASEKIAAAEPVKMASMRTHANVSRDGAERTAVF